MFPQIFVLSTFLSYSIATHAHGGHSNTFRKQDDYGNYVFGYDIVDPYGNKNYRKESGDAWGNKVGSYGIHDADGRLRIVDYVADKNGFRVKIRTNEPGTTNKDSAHALVNGPDYAGYSHSHIPAGKYVPPHYNHGLAYAPARHVYKQEPAPEYGHRVRPAYKPTHKPIKYHIPEVAHHTPEVAHHTEEPIIQHAPVLTHPLPPHPLPPHPLPPQIQFAPEYNDVNPYAFGAPLYGDYSNQVPYIVPFYGFKYMNSTSGNTNPFNSLYS